MKITRIYKKYFPGKTKSHPKQDNNELSGVFSHLNRIIVELEERIHDLMDENERLKKYELLVSNYDTNKSECELTGEPLRVICESAYLYAKSLGMENYLETTVEISGEAMGEPLLFTLQMLSKKTPHELRVEAEKRVELLESEIKDLRDYHRKRSPEELPPPSNDPFSVSVLGEFGENTYSVICYHFPLGLWYDAASRKHVFPTGWYPLPNEINAK